jgi:uncharacterized Ntn-hydrolase superfamily protein
MTYSIIGRDPDSGAMGVATQSQAFAVGSSVPFANPGYGVIATQSMGEPMYGELGLDALQAGLTASEALEALRSVDPHPERRQVAMLDGYGNIDVYTGSACVPEAGHRTGECCAALANMMVSEDVWDAMVEAYEASEGRLADRLMRALHAAEDAGGDVRGTRSAAILVVRAERSGRPWRDHVVDLRVDDATEPLSALDDMVAHSDRYHRMVEAFEFSLEGRIDDALEELGSVEPQPEEDPDLALWRAVVLGKAGRIDDAKELVDRLHDEAPSFVETARRFRSVELVDPDLLDRILPPHGR